MLVDPLKQEQDFLSPVKPDQRLFECGKVDSIQKNQLINAVEMKSSPIQIFSTHEANSAIKQEGLQQNDPDVNMFN